MIKRVVLTVFLGLMCNPFCCFSQDSIPETEDVAEKKLLKFQEYFFKALSEKSIRNYKKAIENLESCNEILPDDETVFFELSKNYLFLNRTTEAKNFIDKALLIEPNNIWMLEHLVAIYKKERNYDDAIKVQFKIINQNPKKRSDLVLIYYFNRDYNNALALMDSLQDENGLSKRLKQLKYSLEQRKGKLVKKKPQNDLAGLISNFENNQSSFTDLKKILELAIKTDIKTFHKYSKLGIDLFPAQPYIYLSRGNSLQMQKKSQEAIDILESGIDFVIDNPALESQFYILLSKVYTSLNNTSKATEYLQKAKRIKNIE